MYKIRKSQSGDWADIIIDTEHEGAQRGRITILSSHGDWTFYWGTCGMAFKNHLIKLQKDYAAGKFRADQFYDTKAILTKATRAVLHARFHGEIDGIEARAVYDELKFLRGEFPVGEALPWALYTSEHVYKFFDGNPPLEKSLNPGFEYFWDNIWPIFVRRLRSEI